MSSTSQNYIITNFAYGTGPYLRTTDLAVAFNDELEKVGRERMGIIVPWVYGEKQKNILLEEFAEHEKKYPGEILLDTKLGALLRSIFYADCTYEEALGAWIKKYRDVSLEAYQHLSFAFEVETLNGEKKNIDGTKIKVELNRSPRIRYNVAPSYFSSFASIADILEQAQVVKEIAVDLDLLKKGVEAAEWVEKHQKMRCIAWPATFSYMQDMKLRYHDEIMVPPIAPLPQSNVDEIEKGIFVTITGIPGLERLYADAKRLGLKLYSNDMEAVPGSEHALPHIIPNKNIMLQFARSGWSSIWISMISGTPLVVPEFDSHDDPEIYFNNSSVEELGLGIVYRGEALEEILAKAESIRQSSARIKQQVLDKWGTLDGNRLCATLFVKDFLSIL